MTNADGAAPAGPAPAPAPSQQLVRVRREVLAACMTCPLCRKLLKEATTISECLHTFCRKCIFEKLTDEEVDCCPICNIDLGCIPVEKLRPDHSLQDVRAKIFPFKRRKVNAPEVPSIPLPIRRKERSLSSLVVNTPRVGTQTGLTGRRTKAATRRATSRGVSPAIDGLPKREDNNIGDQGGNSSSPEALNKLAHNKKQNSWNGEPSNLRPSKDACNGGEQNLDKAELWKPLNCLVEAANRTKSFKSSPPSPSVKAEQINGLDSDIPVTKIKVKEDSNKSKFQDDKNKSGHMSLLSIKAKKFCRRKREHVISAQALIDAASGKRERRTGPIWFSLVAAAAEEGDLPLPQLSANYLRIKDGNLLVSFIHKYLAKKLDLASENEVDLTSLLEEFEPDSDDAQPAYPSIAERHRLVRDCLISILDRPLDQIAGKDFTSVGQVLATLLPRGSSGHPLGLAVESIAFKQSQLRAAHASSSQEIATTNHHVAAHDGVVASFLEFRAQCLLLQEKYQSMVAFRDAKLA